VNILNVDAEINEVRLDEREGRSPVRDEVIKDETETDNLDEVANQVRGADNMTNQEAVPDELANQKGDAEESANQVGVDEMANQEEVELTNREEAAGAANDELEVESCGQGEQIPDDNVEFFLTEEGGEKFVNGVGDNEEQGAEAKDGKTEGEQEAGDVPTEEEDNASVVGSEVSATSGQETARDTFVPVISVDISRKSTENMQNDVAND
jgi:hypothetical protein